MNGDKDNTLGKGEGEVNTLSGGEVNTLSESEILAIWRFEKCIVKVHELLEELQEGEVRRSQELDRVLKERERKANIRFGVGVGLFLISAIAIVMMGFN